MYNVLFASARCIWDKFGEFAPPDAAEALVKINGDEIKFITLQRALYSLTQESRGPILEKRRAARGVRYRFVNQVMPQYILARQVRERRIGL